MTATAFCSAIQARRAPLSPVQIRGAIGEPRLDGAHRDRGEQRDGLGRVTGPARGQREAEQVAEAVRETVPLAGEATP
jgi:hypothetical protein